MNDKFNALSDDMLENVVGGVNKPSGTTMRMDGKADPNKVNNTLFREGSTSGGQTLLGKSKPSGDIVTGTKMSGGVIDNGGIMMC